MLFNSITLLALLASALAAPSSHPSTHSTNNAASASSYSSTTQDSYTIVQNLHTEVYHWTAALNETRDSYSTCTTAEEKRIYISQLKSQFSSLQECVKTAHTSLQKNGAKKGGEHDEDISRTVQDCVQEIRYTGEGLIPVLGHDVVAPLLIGVVNAMNGLLGVLLPLLGGLLGLVFQLLGGVLDLLF